MKTLINISKNSFSTLNTADPQQSQIVFFNFRNLEPNMGRFIKSGRVVIVTAGKYAGRKAVVVKETNEGTQDRLYCRSHKNTINRP